MKSLISSLTEPADSRILLVVLDGLGGLPLDGKTELETARTPNLDRLAGSSSLGLTSPIGTGITPGSGPAHLALFGYDPLEYQVGRGVIEAMGVGIEVKPGDICCRANFATIAEDGTIEDRRAGRIVTERSTELCRILQDGIPKVGDCEVIVRPGREHRFVVVFRGRKLVGNLTETDPQHTGVPPLPVKPVTPDAAPTAEVINEFISKAQKLLAGHRPANGLLLRGLGALPDIPSFNKRFGLRSACVAVYPMYRGLSKLVDMAILDAGETWAEETSCIGQNRADYDFFYLHLKDTDKAGEDGDFQAKVKLIEQFDHEILPDILDLEFDVLCITGDHSTPAIMAKHSWHPVPLLLHSRAYPPQFSSSEFGERACAQGCIGRIPATEAMALMLAHAGRLAKYGA